MSKIKASMKEGAGYIEEEAGEMIGSKKMAKRGRDLRNKGRVAEGKAPKLSKPGTGNK